MVLAHGGRGVVILVRLYLLLGWCVTPDFSGWKCSPWSFSWQRVIRGEHPLGAFGAQRCMSHGASHIHQRVFSCDAPWDMHLWAEPGI
jgi:hypothetical protein